MSLEWEQTITDAHDPIWSIAGDALGWVVVNDDPDEFEIQPTVQRLPRRLFAFVPESTRRMCLSLPRKGGQVLR
jgi:hypothetical protein